MAQRTGHGRGEDAASSRRIEAAEKRARALDLRKAGATYDQIAEQVGFSNRGNAYRAIQTALKELTAEPAHEVQRLEVERLDAMLLGLWGQARRGNQGAVDRVLRIQERRARLLGLDAKTQHDMGIADRQIKLAEEQGALLAGAVNRILDGLGLSKEQWERVPQVVPVVLRAITGGETS